MILKASQRGGGKALGLHLLNAEQNEHVEIHEVRGFMSESVIGAFKEAQAMASGTRCKQYLFSVSLSPPESENVHPEVFEGAIAAIEEKMGLTGQPRVIVFHEKEGRRHAHAVWSRIDAETMTAKHLSHFKRKLGDVARQLYLDNGWEMPDGFRDWRLRDPRNFSLDQWQESKRKDLDPREVKAAILECWKSADNAPAFSRALEQRGMVLAQGRRNNHVAVTFDGRAFAIAKVTGEKAKDVRARLGEPDKFGSVADAIKQIDETVTPRLNKLVAEARRIGRDAMRPLLDERQNLKARHADERSRMDDGQRKRQQSETRERAARLRHGFAGLWDRLTGDYQKTRVQNETEAFFAMERDRGQRQTMIAAQLAERRELQDKIRQTRTREAQQILALYRHVADHRLLSDRRAQNAQQEFNRHSRAETPRGPQQPERGLDLGH